MSWAFALELRPSSLKFLLVALADSASHEGEVFPSIETLAGKTCQDRKTVIAGIGELERIGFLSDTGKRVGRTKQIRVFSLTGFDSGERHYTYRVCDPATGEFYVGVRSCWGAPESDVTYMGSGTWPLIALRNRRSLAKVVLAEHSSRKAAEAAEAEAIRIAIADPLCRNLNGPENGMHPKNGTVPIFPSNSTVFPPKGSRKRDTDPRGIRKGTKERVVSDEPSPSNLNVEAWHRWEQYRLEIRKPIHPASKLSAQRKLADFGTDQSAVVEQSIANGYQGLFALKAENRPKREASEWR